MASISRKRPIRYDVPASRDLRRTYTSSVTNFRGIYNTETTIEMAPGAMNDACNVYVDEDYRLVTRKRLTPLFLPEKDVTVIDSVSLGDDIYAIIKDNTTGAEHEYAFLKLYPTKTYIDYRVTADSRLFVANNSIYITRCNSGDQFGVLLYNGTSVSSLTEGANIPTVYLDPTGRRIAVNEYGDASEALNIFSTKANNGPGFRFSSLSYSTPYDLRGKFQNYITTEAGDATATLPARWERDACDASGGVIKTVAKLKNEYVPGSSALPSDESEIPSGVQCECEVWVSSGITVSTKVVHLNIIRSTASLQLSTNIIELFPSGSNKNWDVDVDGEFTDENILRKYHIDWAWALNNTSNPDDVIVRVGISNYGIVEGSKPTSSSNWGIHNFTYKVAGPSGYVDTFYSCANKICLMSPVDYGELWRKESGTLAKAYRAQAVYATVSSGALTIETLAFNADNEGSVTSFTVSDTDLTGDLTSIKDVTLLAALRARYTKTTDEPEYLIVDSPSAVSLPLAMYLLRIGTALYTYCPITGATGEMKKLSLPFTDAEAISTVLALSFASDEIFVPAAAAPHTYEFPVVGHILAKTTDELRIFKIDAVVSVNTSFVGTVNVSISKITPNITKYADYTSVLLDGVEVNPKYTELIMNDDITSFVANATTLVTKYSRTFGSEASLKVVNVYAYTTPVLGQIRDGALTHEFEQLNDGSMKVFAGSGSITYAYSESQLYGTTGTNGFAYADPIFDITEKIGTALYTVWNDAREAMKNIDGVYSMNNCIIFTSGRNFAYSMTFSPKYVDPYSWEQMSSTDDKVLDILAISPTAAIMSTEKGMYWILGTGTGQLTHLKPVVSQFDIHGRKRGSFARRAMDDVPTIMCDDGVMMFVGTSEVTETAKNIATMSSAIFQKYDEFLANEQRRFTFRGRWYNMYCISTGAETKIVFFDVRSSAWWYWTLPIDAMKFFRSGDDLLALTSNGLIYKFTDEDMISNNGYTARYNDELVNVSFENVTPFYENLQYKVQWYIQTHPMSLGNTTKNKNMRDIVLALYPNETVKNFEMNVDFEVYTREFTDGRPYITTEDIKELKVLLLRTYIPKFQYIAVRMYSKNDLSVYEKLQLRSLAFEYRILDRLN